MGLVRAEWPEFGPAELDALVGRGRLDWRLVDGEQRFLRSCVDSLRLYPAEVPGLACPPADRTAQLAVIEEMRREGAAERRIRLRHLIRAAAASRWRRGLRCARGCRAVWLAGCRRAHR